MSLRGLFPQCSPSSSGSPSGVYLLLQPAKEIALYLPIFLSNLLSFHPPFLFSGRLTVAWHPARMKEMCNWERKEEKDESKAKSHPRLPGPTCSTRGVQFHHTFQLWNWFQLLVKSPKLPNGGCFLYNKQRWNAKIKDSFSRAHLKLSTGCVCSSLEC